MTYVYYVICHTVNAFLFASFAVFAARLPGKIQNYRLCMWRYSATTRIKPSDLHDRDATKVLQDCYRVLHSVAGRTSETLQRRRNRKTS